MEKKHAGRYSSANRDRQQRHTSHPAPAAYEEAEIMYEEKRLAYRDRAVELCKKGGIGFAIGAIIGLLGFHKDGFSTALSAILTFGLVFAGVPYGWEVLGRILGHWLAYGNFVFVLIVHVFQFLFSYVVGLVAFPIALLYNAMRAQKKGSITKIVITIAFGIYLAFIIYLVLGFSGVFDKKNEIPEEPTAPMASQMEAGNPSESAANLLTDPSAFTLQNPEYISVCQEALDGCIAEENADRADGDEIIEPSALRAAYFLNVKTPGTEHYYGGHNVKMTNAVIVFTSYTANILHTRDREEWFVWVFPDCAVDENGNLNFAKGKKYKHYLNSFDLDRMYAWLCDEYNDMDITELALPD